ncbi:hypothetical protein N8I71_17790 [Roseibacterium sp. SDUM158016]|uniref:hypothetical protein n=1 Tax=Roseicyclus sediminis TaxID=2980997 RepID=UPI0021CEB680|nr:hypothetical protein [Roseibacterium sp. SDUM158016]MCU4654695.1 hypothetical protein [Roseibacterium sp. SDUM158016]
MSKKKARRVYEGELNKPLPPFPTVLDEDHGDRKTAHDAAVQERIGLLFDLYSVNPADPVAWRKLAFELMADHVPGFQYVEPRADGDRLVEILFNIEYLVRKHGVSPDQASAVLSGIKPELGKPDAIRTYYFDVKRHPSKAGLARFFQWAAEQTSAEALISALEGEVLPAIAAIEDLQKAKRGRPRKK